MGQRYAVRADHERRQYEVYSTVSGETVETFHYRSGKEKDRAMAAGQAAMARAVWNENEESFHYDPAKMFPFASARRMTD